MQHLLKSKEQGEHTGLPQNRYRWCAALARIWVAEGDLNGALDNRSTQTLAAGQTVDTHDFGYRGLGSLGGAFVASLLIGCIQTFSVGLSISITDVFALIGVTLPEGSQVARLTITQMAPVLPYVLMVAILIFRPRGLMGSRES